MPQLLPPRRLRVNLTGIRCNRAEATVESLRAQLKEAEQAKEQLFEAQKTIYDLKEKIVSLQKENGDLKRKLEHARMWL
jgi:predicted  nucleic acid-binding Zn-ribbon protein